MMRHRSSMKTSVLLWSTVFLQLLDGGWALTESPCSLLTPATSRCVYSCNELGFPSLPYTASPPSLTPPPLPPLHLLSSLSYTSSPPSLTPPPLPLLHLLPSLPYTSSPPSLTPPPLPPLHLLPSLPYTASPPSLTHRRCCFFQL